jgi:hypothetical protein
MPENQRLLDICKDVSQETNSNKLADLVPVKLARSATQVVNCHLRLNAITN